MLNKELLLCGSSTQGYPPNPPPIAGSQAILITASNPGGGIDGFDFQWLDSAPSSLSDEHGSLLWLPFPWIEDIDAYIAPYKTYYTLIANSQRQSRHIDITYKKNATPSGMDFFATKCIPVRNCSSCTILKSNALELSLHIDIVDPTQECHIHLEQRS